jgi:hypothetical protein
MSVRRERPPVQGSRNSITLRLPDGTVKTMPVREDRDEGDDVCCFCGESVEPADSGRISVLARWVDQGHDRTQAWDAHRKCFAERVHDSVSGTGPFFGD